MMMMVVMMVAAASISARVGAAFSVRNHAVLHHSPRDATSLLTRCFASASPNQDDENEMHRKQYSISGTGQRSKVTCQTNTNHILETDVPKKMGGGDEAPQPVEHLLAALLGCTQATAVYCGRMMKPRLVIDKIDFNIEAYRDQRGALSLPIAVTPAIPARLQKVAGTVIVTFKDGTEVSEEQLHMLGKQTEARCPVANMMTASGCIMEIEWKNGANII
jgi:putative redox protein